MRKATCLLILVGAAFVLSGCAGTMHYERHFGVKNDPFSIHRDNVLAGGFDVLGPVEAEGESINVLGIVVRGTEGHGLLTEAARRKYGEDATTVVFASADYNYEGILYPIFGTVKTRYYGIAVKGDKLQEIGAGTYDVNVNVKQE